MVTINFVLFSAMIMEINKLVCGGDQRFVDLL